MFEKRKGVKNGKSMIILDAKLTYAEPVMVLIEKWGIGFERMLTLNLLA